MKQARIIDLSYPVHSRMLVYPNTARPVFQWLGRVNSEGYNLTRMEMLTHTGTHADAPSHFIAGEAKTIDELPLDLFFGRARLFRFREEPRGQEIGLKDLLSTGFDLEPETIFVLQTGIERHQETAEYNLRYPAPAEDLIEYLIGKRIKSYMTDATSLDAQGSGSDLKHKRVLGAGIPIVENLRNLDLLPENKPFLICALPLSLTGREGSPCRAVAMPEMDGLWPG